MKKFIIVIGLVLAAAIAVAAVLTPVTLSSQDSLSVFGNNCRIKFTQNGNNGSLKCSTFTPTRTPTPLPSTATPTPTVVPATPTATNTAVIIPTATPTLPPPTATFTPTSVPVVGTWPYSTVQLGAADSPGGAGGLAAVAPFGFRYQYLAGGVNTGAGWETWNTNGQFVTFYIQESVANNIVPVFTYYEMFQSTPGNTLSEGNADYTNLQNASTMTSYYNNLKLFFQRAAGTSPVVLHVEADLWGYMQQRSTNDDASSVPAQVSSTGLADLSGIPNNVQGFALAIKKLRDLYAPNVLLGYHMSIWGTGNDIQYTNPDNATLDALAARSAKFYNSLGNAFDATFGEFSDRDAAFKQFVYGDGGASWWDAGDYTRHIRYLSDYSAATGSRIVLWQIPLGNTKMLAENNTWDHYQDNRVETILDPSRSIITAYKNAGVVAFLFGRGADGATCACDAAGDGVTNPAAINGNTGVSLNSDDDGGYFKQQAAVYYGSGVINIGTSSPTPTATSTATVTQPTATATVANTPTSTAVPTSINTSPTAVQATATATPTSSGFEANCLATLDPSGASQCGSSTGNPNDYYFCDRWSGGFCDDFRSKQTVTHVPFPALGDPYSVDLMDATDPNGGWTDCCHDGTFMPEVFTANEHFMIAWTSANFGDAIVRLHQPFDFAGRTGHIHFDADLKTASRRYVRLTLSPDLTKRGNDDRSGTTGGNSFAYPNNGLDLWFQSGQVGSGSTLGIGVTEMKNGGCGSGYCFKSIADTSTGYPSGHDNVRDHVDVYVSRTSLTILVNNTQVFSQAIPDVGFDRSYIYLQQAMYNPCKEGAWPAEVWPNSSLDQCSMAAQMFHWDNIAFDGPVLPLNSLTPQGSEDVIFNAYSASSCTVKGITATPNGLTQQYTWITWTVRLPANTPVTTSDIQCTVNFPSIGVQNLEVVEQ